MGIYSNNKNTNILPNSSVASNGRRQKDAIQNNYNETQLVSKHIDDLVSRSAQRFGEMMSIHDYQNTLAQHSSQFTQPFNNTVMYHPIPDFSRIEPFMKNAEDINDRVDINDNDEKLATGGVLASVHVSDSSKDFIENATSLPSASLNNSSEFTDVDVAEQAMMEEAAIYEATQAAHPPPEGRPSVDPQLINSLSNHLSEIDEMASFFRYNLSDSKQKKHHIPVPLTMTYLDEPQDKQSSLSAILASEPSLSYFLGNSFPIRRKSAPQSMSENLSRNSPAMIIKSAHLHPQSSTESINFAEMEIEDSTKNSIASDASEVKRARNRVSAYRSRLRRKYQIQHIQSDIAHYKQENSVLTSQLEKLREVIRTCQSSLLNNAKLSLPPPS